jgi:transposase-like protein
VTRKRYTAEFKAQAVELVALGKPVAVVAEDLEVGAGILYGCGAKWPTSNSRMTF